MGNIAGIKNLALARQNEMEINYFSWKIMERHNMASQLMTETIVSAQLYKCWNIALLCKYWSLYVCKQQLVNLTFKLPASRQEHEAGNCFWDSQSEKALGKQEESVTVVLSGVSHRHNDLPTCLSESVIHLLIPSSKGSIWGKVHGSAFWTYN